MSLSSIVEKWDTIAYLGYNLLARAVFLIKYPKYKKYLKKNKGLYQKHEGEQCFIVLNGPSINKYDLTKLSNEYVFCVNYFFDSNYVDVVKPNYYCVTDSSFFKNKDSADNLKRLYKKCSYSKFIFNINYLDNHTINNEQEIYLTYGKQMPNTLSLSNNLCTMSSGFISVSLYAMNAAIFMGFKEIYILGYDFEPGILSHFYSDTEVENDLKNIQRAETSKDDVCGKYWQYSQGQYQNYYMRKYAQKRGVNIYNCNEQSCVRAFPFAVYESIVAKQGEEIEYDSTCSILVK